MKQSTKQVMKLRDTEFRFRNAGASDDLVIKVTLGVNTSREKQLEYFEKNITNDCKWIKTEPEHDGTAIICGASPSLKNNIGAIKEAQSNGAALFACNASAKFLHKNGLEIDYQPILDSTDLVIYDVFMGAKCHLIASTVKPLVFEMAKTPILWHPLMQWIADYMESDSREFTYIGGGITVCNSALCLAYTMGYRKMMVYGMDSSFLEDKFYAAGDIHPDDERLFVDVDMNGKTFKTTYDMKQQVVVFLELLKKLKMEGCAVDVFCEGLMEEAIKGVDTPELCQN